MNRQPFSTSVFSRRGLAVLGALAAALFAGCGSETAPDNGAPAVTGATPPTSPKSTSASPSSSSDAKSITILNVSYDPTREFYAAFNKVFAEKWSKETGQTVTIEQSHGGSGKQARAVIDGLEADVVTLALAYDIDAIANKSGQIDKAWRERLPHNSAPYTSTIVFLVRKGNPKGIANWDDLLKPDVEVVTANPKTGGGARWNYLAAWGFALQRELGDLAKISDPAATEEVAAAQKKARAFVGEMFKHVKVLDPSARQATTTFLQRGIGDVLLAWENEAHLAVAELGAGEVEIVTPKISILAEPSVAWVDSNVAKRGTERVAKAYLEALYTPEGQRLAAKHHFRPADETAVPAEERSEFATIERFTIDQVFGGWTKAQAQHFDDGGVFDELQQENQ